MYHVSFTHFLTIYLPYIGPIVMYLIHYARYHATIGLENDQAIFSFISSFPTNPLVGYTAANWL